MFPVSYPCEVLHCRNVIQLNEENDLRKRSIFCTICAQKSRKYIPQNQKTFAYRKNIVQNKHQTRITLEQTREELEQCLNENENEMKEFIRNVTIEALNSLEISEYMNFEEIVTDEDVSNIFRAIPQTIVLPQATNNLLKHVAFYNNFYGDIFNICEDAYEVNENYLNINNQLFQKVYEFNDNYRKAVIS
jgi:hypothetical protein